MLEVQGALRQGRSRNPIIVQAWTRMKLWDLYGLRLEDLNSMPWQEGQDLITIAEAVTREQVAAQRNQESRSEDRFRTMGYSGG